MDKKIVIGIIVATIVILGGAITLLSNSPSNSKAALEKTSGAKIEVLESSFDFKDIPYSGGKAIHEFKIKSSGDQPLEIANLATSCMCTEVYLKTPQEEGPKSGMKGMSTPTTWIGTLQGGEEGLVVAVFDPSYHGPSGVGPVSRMVSFETNDPNKPYIELSFTGNVVK